MVREEYFTHQITTGRLPIRGGFRVCPMRSPPSVPEFRKFHWTFKHLAQPASSTPELSAVRSSGPTINHLLKVLNLLCVSVKLHSLRVSPPLSWYKKIQVLFDVLLNKLLKLEMCSFLFFLLPPQSHYKWSFDEPSSSHCGFTTGFSTLLTPLNLRVNPGSTAVLIARWQKKKNVATLSLTLSLQTYVCRCRVCLCSSWQTAIVRRHCGEVPPRIDDSVGKCFGNEGIIVQWQSELHSKPSVLAAGAEQNSGQESTGIRIHWEGGENLKAHTVFPAKSGRWVIIQTHFLPKSKVIQLHFMYESV